MFRNSNPIILSLLLPHLTLVPAYYVHSSCGSVPAFRSAINKAFTFASTTVDLYNNKNENMLDVGEFLFPGDTEQKSISKCQYQKRDIPIQLLNLTRRTGNLAGLQQISEYKLEKLSISKK